MTSARIRLGGSSAHIWTECTGSVAHNAALPPLPEDVHMFEGTVAHRLGEQCLSLGLDPEDFISRFILGHEVSPEMADAVTNYTDTVRNQAKESCSSLVSLEQTIKLTQIHADLEGTNDSSVLVPETATLYVNEYKHGAGRPVDVIDNHQLRFYGLGALLAALKTGAQVERIVLTVVQPRCAHADGPIRSTELSPLDLYTFGSTLKTVVDEIKSSPRFKVGPWCDECQGAGACKALYDHVRAIKDAAALPLDLLSRDELAERLSLTYELQAFIKGVRRFAYTEAQRGRAPTGLKLVATHGRLVWVDSDAAMAAALQYFADEVAESDLFRKKPITPRQFANLVGEHADRFLNAFAVRKRNVSLVPLSDDREEVKPAALRDFEDVFDTEEDSDV